MIIPRLLRFGLGAGWGRKEQDGLDHTKEIEQARMENNERARRVGKAEAEVMGFMGMSGCTPDELEALRSMNNEEHETEYYDASEREIATVAVGGCLWQGVAFPLYSLRVKSQTFLLRGGYWQLLFTKLRKSPIGTGTGTGFIEYLFHDSVLSLFAASDDYYKPFSIWSWPLLIGWTVLYPLKERVMCQVLGLPLPHLKTLVTLGNYRRVLVTNWTTFGLATLYEIARSVVTTPLINAVIGWDVGHVRVDVIPERVSRMTIAMFRELAVDYATMFCSTLVYKSLARDYGVVAAVGTDWRMLIQACAVEWLVTCGAAYLAARGYKWLVKSKLR